MPLPYESLGRKGLEWSFIKITFLGASPCMLEVLEAEVSRTCGEGEPTLVKPLP